jgi:hypothetical protein
MVHDAHDNGRTMVRAEYGNTEGSPNLNGQTRDQPLQLPLQQAPQRAPKRTTFKPQGTTINKAVAKELANRSTYQIQYVIVVIINTVFRI